MSVPRAVAVAGFKKAGKTKVVEALVRELSVRGHKVGTLKHASQTHPIDSPGKDTWRHEEAGAVASAILTSERAAVFLARPLSIAEAVARLGVVDFVVIEGFKSLDSVARIIVLRNADEIGNLSNGLEILVSGPSVEKLSIKEGTIPIIPLSRIGELTDVVEAKAFPLLPGLDCGGCGYGSCRDLARAILAGDAGAERCVSYAGGAVRLTVDGVAVPMKSFVQDVIGNAVVGMVRALKGVGDVRRVELSIDAGGDGDG
jgi:molybdopterin-guanine dinucleotide biosynthesis protein B